MKATAKLTMKVEDFTVTRTVSISGAKSAKDARGDLETKARAALGELADIVYEELLRLQVPPSDPRQGKLPIPACGTAWPCHWTRAVATIRALAEAILAERQHVMECESCEDGDTCEEDIRLWGVQVALARRVLGSDDA